MSGVSEPRCASCGHERPEHFTHSAMCRRNDCSCAAWQEPVPEPRTPEAALAEGPHRCDGSAADEIAHVLAIPDGSPDDPGSMEYARWCVERLRLDGWSLVRTPTDGDLTAEMQWATRVLYRYGLTSPSRDAELRALTGQEPPDRIEQAARRTAPDDYDEVPCCFSIHEIEQTCPRTGRTWTGESAPTDGDLTGEPYTEGDIDDIEWIVWFARKQRGTAREVALSALEQNPTLRFTERESAARRTALTDSPSPDDAPSVVDQLTVEPTEGRA